MGLFKKKQEEKILLKLTCYTPKGKAKKSSKTARGLFGKIHLPKETVLLDDSSFYYIYEGTEKQCQKIIDKIPKAESTVRKVYAMLLHFIERGNKIGKKYAWKLEKTRAWILNQLRKKKIKHREFEEMLDSIEIQDKEDIINFLGGELFKAELLGPVDQEGKKAD